MSLIERLSSTMQKYKEEAGAERIAIDANDLSDSELADTATLYRLMRLADVNLNAILADHLSNITNAVTADRMVSVLTEDYLADLPISFSGLTKFATSINLTIAKYKVKPNQALIDAANGDFDFLREMSIVDDGLVTS